MDKMNSWGKQCSVTLWVTHCFRRKKKFRPTFFVYFVQNLTKQFKVVAKKTLVQGDVSNKPTVVDDDLFNRYPKLWTDLYYANDNCEFQSSMKIP